MALYEDLKQYITDKMYTIVQCQNMLNNYYKFKQLTDEQYEELMEMSKDLEPNNPDDALDAKFTAIDVRFQTLETQVANLKKEIEESGSTVPPVEEADGSEFNPIKAYTGLAYKKNLFYLDPTNNEVYKCIDRADIPENGVVLYNLPHELVNIYFNWVRKEVKTVVL